MPVNTIVGPLTIPSDRWNELVNKEVDECLDYLNSIVKSVDTVESSVVKLSTYFSIIDSMVQNGVNYAPNVHQADIFAEFVSQHQKSCSYISEIEPVTLYYRNESALSNINLFDYLEDGQIYNMTSQSIINMRQVILDELAKHYPTDKVAKLSKEHTITHLLYRLRCFTAHEFSANHISNFKTLSEPYYICFGRRYVVNNNVVDDNVWKYMIPPAFVKTICMDCITQYLENCRANKQMPYHNNTLDRVAELSWYNK